MASYIYSKTINNDYLNKIKTLKAPTIGELEMKIASQTAIWDKQEAAQRERDRVSDLKQRAEEKNSAAARLIDSYKSILPRKPLSVCAYNWKKDYLREKFPEFKYTYEAPTIMDFYHQYSVPKKSFLEQIFAKLKIKRETLEKEAEAAFQTAFAEYEKTKQDAFENWQNEKDAHDAHIAMSNAEVDRLHAAYEAAQPDGVEYLITKAVSAIEFADNCISSFDVHYEPSSQVLVVRLFLPNTDEIPRIVGYKYIASTKTIKSIMMKDKEFAAFYDDVIKQIALTTIRQVFAADYANRILSVVFNGWINGVNKATGKDYEACIISVQAARKVIDEICFEKVDAGECIRSLKGLYSGNLAQLAPVTPILEFDRDDSRFVEARDIIDTLDTGDNLATMDWESFEHLVRELFSKYFAQEGADVKVTQSSRDGGVDAVAFDPNPIRGGKFVIQAKRYNRVVPVSATRDLYGTMLNEGASRGILVTTSYYGNDSREFVKDKPITLIDGQNLIKMFSDFGYDVHIELQKKLNDGYEY